MKKYDFFILGTLLSGIFVVLFPSCGENTKHLPERSKKEVSVKFFTLGEGTRIRYRMFPGIIAAEEKVNLSFHISGQLVVFDAGPGKAVRKGALLARLDPVSLQATLDSAEAKYSEAKKDFDRYMTLYEKKIVSLSDYEKKKRDLDIAQSSLRSAKDDLENSEIFAPFTGIISDTYADNFQHVNANQTLIRLQNLSSFQVSIDVPEKFVIYAGDSIEEVNLLAEKVGGFYGVMSSYDGKSERFKLVLKEASLEADSATQTFRVTFRIIKNPNVRLLPGMTLEVFVPDLFPRGHARDAASGFDVPVSAIFPKGGKEFVWRIASGGKISSIEVKTSSPFGIETTIYSPELKKGDVIAASGAVALHEGDFVRELPRLGSRKSAGF